MPDPAQTPAPDAASEIEDARLDGVTGGGAPVAPRTGAFSPDDPIFRAPVKPQYGQP